MRIFGLLAILLMTCFAGQAQDSKTDTVALANDTIRLKNGKLVRVEDYVKRFDPRKALFYSAILPGAGQVYNKKYWKVPLVYGGLLGLAAVVKYYNDAQVKYSDQLYFLINNPTLTIHPVSGKDQKQLRSIVDVARRQRDYFAIFVGFFYILQLVDAHVDAHLKEFDVNPKLHVRLEPSYTPAGGPGLGLTLRF
ncbi:hypothetical protein WSM22_28430 [Cytophagales bacterium WSM2-2]|nr:hypothetical protein WSM22_28430 [Cytophagales bacterium WSM2-2]